MSERIGPYKFGPYEVHMRTRELYNQGIRLKLRPQAFQVLQVLVEHAGDVVTREEFRQMLWPAGTFVDFEHGLNTSVKELRRVLGDSAGSPRFIETLPKIGYRLMVPVKREESATSVSPGVELQGSSHDPEILAAWPNAQPKPGRHRTWMLYAALALLMAAL